MEVWSILQKKVKFVQKFLNFDKQWQNLAKNLESNF